MTSPQIAAGVNVFPSAEALWGAAADEVARSAADAIRSHGRFNVALAGGETPEPLYDLLASDDYAGRIDWVHVEVFWGDERAVPPADQASNYRMAREHLLERVAVPARNVHRIRGEDDPAAAALAYERELRTSFSTPHGPPQLTAGARFDLVLLGMGRDGHTASLFPGSTGAGEHDSWSVAQRSEVAPASRVSLTPVVLNAAAEIVFMVVGDEKAATLGRVLEGPRRPDLLPAQAIAPRAGRLCWLVDASAASKLKTC